jgi:hypothetical protein
MIMLAVVYLAAYVVGVTGDPSGVVVVAAACLVVPRKARVRQQP